MKDKNPPLVVSLGGSVLFSVEDVTDASQVVENIRGVCEVLARAAEEKRVGVVVGGGPFARIYIGFGRKMGMGEKKLDEIGITFTRLNARLVIRCFQEMGLGVPEVVPETVETAARLLKNHRLVVMGGTVPGHTTDAVSAMLAREVGAVFLVNVTNVDGIYTADPRKDPGAKRLDFVSFDRLVSMTSSAEGIAGANVVVDPVAARIIKEASIPMVVVNGKDRAALERALRGDFSVGTLVAARPRGSPGSPGPP